MTVRPLVGRLAAGLLDARLVDLAAGIARLEGRSSATCTECGRAWTDESERWRTYLTDDGKPALFCPECAEREFGGDDAS